jgi:hypothetical protein
VLVPEALNKGPLHGNDGIPGINPRVRASQPDASGYLQLRVGTYPSSGMCCIACTRTVLCKSIVGLCLSNSGKRKIPSTSDQSGADPCFTTSINSTDQHLQRLALFVPFVGLIASFAGSSLPWHFSLTLSFSLLRFSLFLSASCRLRSFRVACSPIVAFVHRPLEPTFCAKRQ